MIFSAFIEEQPVIIVIGYYWTGRIFCTSGLEKTVLQFSFPSFVGLRMLRRPRIHRRHGLTLHAQVDQDHNFITYLLYLLLFYYLKYLWILAFFQCYYPDLLEPPDPDPEPTFYNDNKFRQVRIEDWQIYWKISYYLKAPNVLIWSFLSCLFLDVSVSASKCKSELLLDRPVRDTDYFTLISVLNYSFILWFPRKSLFVESLHLKQKISIPRNRFRQPILPSGPVRQIGLSKWPARLGIKSWVSYKVYKYVLCLQILASFTNKCLLNCD